MQKQTLLQNIKTTWRSTDKQKSFGYFQFLVSLCPFAISHACEGIYKITKNAKPECKMSLSMLTNVGFTMCWCVDKHG